MKETVRPGYFLYVNHIINNNNNEPGENFVYKELVRLKVCSARYAKTWHGTRCHGCNVINKSFRIIK